MAFLKIFFKNHPNKYISSKKKKEEEIREIFACLSGIGVKRDKQKIVGYQYRFDFFLNYSIKRKHWQTKRRIENRSTLFSSLACTQPDFLSAKVLAVVRLWEEPSRSRNCGVNLH